MDISKIKPGRAPAAYKQVALAIVLLASAAAQAQAVEIGTVSGRHDDIANCLVRSLPSHLTGSPSVSVPPRADAIVNVYRRGNDEAVDPVTVFSLRGDGSGSVRISLTSSADRQYEAMALAAVQRCAPSIQQGSSRGD